MGIAEFSLPRLREFFASDLKRKPIVNQVNLKDCCSVNSALTDFINKHDMQLLVHSDLSSKGLPTMRSPSPGSIRFIAHTDLLPDSTFLSLLDSFKQQLPPGLKHSYPGMTPRWVLKVRERRAKGREKAQFTKLSSTHSILYCTNTEAWWQIKGAFRLRLVIRRDRRPTESSFALRYIVCASV